MWTAAVYKLQPGACVAAAAASSLSLIIIVSPPFLFPLTFSGFAKVSPEKRNSLFWRVWSSFQNKSFLDEKKCLLVCGHTHARRLRRG
jgi:hypothetical protein